MGNFVEMGKDKTVQRIGEWRRIAVRGIGRRKCRWQDDVSADPEKMKIQS